MLYTINKLNGERSINAVYHMLQGKKSSQTIQDAHLFALLNVFGIVSSITHLQFDQIIQVLTKHHLIQAKDNEKHDVFILTSKGEEILMKATPFPCHINGWKYQNSSQIFWERLNLLIQTLSHIIHMQPRFYPIQRHPKIQQFIKFFLQNHKQNRELLARQLFEELVRILALESEAQQTIFVRKLTGSNRVGETFEQISQSLNLDEWYVRFLFLDSLHWMLQEIEEHPEGYVLLRALMGDIEQNYLTKSTQKTLYYLKEGLSLKEIANIRRLKENTIEDHLVELVLTDNQFPIHRYVSASVERKILEAITKLATKQLKVIKESLNDDEISFFQIRLVLAKAGEVV